MARNYKNIIAWQKGHELTLNVYKLTVRFPKDERFGAVKREAGILGSLIALEAIPKPVHARPRLARTLALHWKFERLPAEMEGERPREPVLG